MLNKLPNYQKEKIWDCEWVGTGVRMRNHKVIDFMFSKFFIELQIQFYIDVRF